MKQHARIIPILFFMVLATSCTSCDQAALQLHDVMQGKDRMPPVLVSTQAISRTVITCTFNEPISIPSSQQWTVAGQTPLELQAQDNTVVLTSPAPVARGQSIEISGRVQDDNGNSTWFSTSCWGHNDRLPHILINECTTKGTASNPDRVELKILSDGNLAGMVLADGPHDLWENRIILPPTEVKKGDFIIIYWQEPATLIPSTSRIHQFQMEGYPGLGGNNGALVLNDSPASYATILDAVIYTSRTMTTHDGFGSIAMKNKALTLVQANQWTSSDKLMDATIAVDSTKSTATRSMSRKLNIEDTNTSSDWYITQTKGATFGLENTSEPYLEP